MCIRDSPFALCAAALCFFDSHRDSKKHKAAAQRAKGKAMLEAMRAGRAVAS